MSKDGDAVTEITILGCGYSIKVPAEQRASLIASAQLFQGLLAETKAQSPALVSNKLLVMAALKLCARQLALEQAQPQDVQQIEAQVRARIDAMARLIRPTLGGT